MQEISGERYLVALLNIVLQTGRYLKEHDAIFGTGIKYGLPPKLSKEKLKQVDSTFIDWLNGKKLYALIPFFVYSQAAQVRSVVCFATLASQKASPGKSSLCRSDNS
jgi:hypothetical protein